MSENRVLVGKRMTRNYYHLEPEGDQTTQEMTAEYEEMTAGVFAIIHRKRGQGMHEKLIHRYCRAAGELSALLPAAEAGDPAGTASTAGGPLRRAPGKRAEDLEAAFGTPQAVAAAYIDDMDTGELLAALRHRRRVLRLVGVGLLAALAIWLTACIISTIDLHKAAHSDGTRHT